MGGGGVGIAGERLGSDVLTENSRARGAMPENKWGAGYCRRTMREVVLPKNSWGGMYCPRTVGEGRHCLRTRGRDCLRIGGYCLRILREEILPENNLAGGRGG